MMKRRNKLMVLSVALIMFTLMMTGCFRQDYLMFEDGDFDGIEFSVYDLIQNAELEMDDIDR